MAWFSKTLTDMQKAIEREDWEEAKRILDAHDELVTSEACRKAEYDLFSLGRDLQDYGSDLRQIKECLHAKLEKGRSSEGVMNAKIYTAIQSANRFEAALLHLVQLGKKLK